MERSKFFDDLAGVAGGAMSALAGLRDEAESTVRARVEEVIRKLDLVRREDLDVVTEIAARARTAQEALEARIVVLEAKLAASGQSGSSTVASAEASASASAAAGELPVPPPTDAAEEPRPDTPELRAPKSVS